MPEYSETRSPIVTQFGEQKRNEAASTSQVAVQLGQLDGRLSQLVTLAEEIEIRLCGVLVSRAPEEKGKSQLSETMVPLAENIRSLNTYAERAIGTLVSVIDRLQL